MFSRIRKRNLVRKAPHFKTQQSRTLLDAFQSSDRLFKIPTYNNCMNSGILFYEVSLQESSRYAEYICQNRSDCDVLKYSSTELLAISQQYQKAEAEFKKTIERMSRF